jgi:aryl-alcohol dehydrogenase-like predicted oxidoreductase
MDDSTGAGGQLERRVLGRTGIEVTAMGFGAGGFSRAGLAVGIDHTAAIIAEALDSGVTLIDTAEAYRTEPGVALGISRSSVGREDIVISTKVLFRTEDGWRTPTEIEAAVHARLEALGTDYLDVVHIHGVRPKDYERVRDESLLGLQRCVAAGTVRSIGITEAFRVDLRHETLVRAIADGVWDVIMVGFNLLNQSARETVLHPAIEADIGVMDMFAVRQALRDMDVLTDHLHAVSADGTLPGTVDVEAELARLASHVSANGSSLPDLAYRFVREEPGISSVLVGTGNPDHLRDNLATFASAPLDPTVLEDLSMVLAGIAALNGETGGLPPK